MVKNKVSLNIYMFVNFEKIQNDKANIMPYNNNSLVGKVYFLSTMTMEYIIYNKCNEAKKHMVLWEKLREIYSD
jgi:hypothetical protein